MKHWFMHGSSAVRKADQVGEMWGAASREVCQSPHKHCRLVIRTLHGAGEGVYTKTRSGGYCPKLYRSFGEFGVMKLRFCIKPARIRFLACDLSKDLVTNFSTAIMHAVCDR